MTTFDASSIPAEEDVLNFPPSFAQERLWFLDQFEPDSSLYNLFTVVRLKGDFSLQVLQKSFDTIIERHESLRTVFGTENDQPVQIILPPSPLPIRLVDLRAWSKEEREVEVMSLAQADTVTPFDLARGPLIRVSVLKLDEAEHVLVIIFHHIIFDGWSAKVFFNELDKHYTAYASGQPSPLPDLTIQYADYASWQKEWLQGEALGQELAFWKTHLAGAPSLLEIPADRPRPPTQSFQGARLTFQLSQEVTDALEHLSRKNNATLFMTILAAFEVFLGRYTNQQDFVIGTPIAGRTRVELEPLIGYFANTLVLRANLSDDPTFIEVMRRVRDMALNAFVHQELPFEKLVEELHPERSLSYNPLFQVLFAFQNITKDQMQLGDLQISEVKISRLNSKFDLSLYSWIDEDGLLKGSFEYNSDLFNSETIQRMQGNFITLLQGIVAQPEQRIALLPMIVEVERHQLLHEWNATQTATQLNHSLHQMIADQAERTPDAIAVIDDVQTLTYRTLNQRANQLARYLNKFNISPDQPIGLCVNRSAEMIVAMLGILKIGGAYVPLDPDYPAERLTFMASDAGLAALVVQEQTAQILPSFTGPRVTLDTDRATIAQEGTSDITTAVLPGHLAYIIYTSGSTGVPKGVQISHAAVVNFLTAMREKPGMTATDVGLALTSISFDIAGLEIYLPLTLGARVVVVSREVATDANTLAHVIDTARVTLMQATPATWRALLDAGWRGQPHLKMLCGGEAMSRNLAGALLEHGGTLWNMYGPTETTIWSTIHQVTDAEGSIPIGRPIDNTQVYLLDAQLQLVPVGVPGEVYIGGNGLARGYRHRADLTSERFIPDPFTGINDARLYRTGDAARYRVDGTIEYIGRLDTQVKVRGFRIELEEVETVLSQHAAISQAAVIVREDIPGDQRITAYLTVKGNTPESNSLRTYMQTRLPAYMIPAAFVVLPTFPLTPNGKVNRSALPAPEGELSDASTFVAPRTPVEAAIAEIWASVLSIEQVGVEDNFFELGGHSLLATQMMARIRDAFQVDVPLRTLFEAPTVAEFTRTIVNLQEHAPAQQTPLVPILRSIRRQRADATADDA
jgi:amino acid adenylation domain-containing protein